MVRSVAAVSESRCDPTSRFGLTKTLICRRDDVTRQRHSTCRDLGGATHDATSPLSQSPLKLLLFLLCKSWSSVFVLSVTGFRSLWFFCQEHGNKCGALKQRVSYILLKCDRQSADETAVLCLPRCKHFSCNNRHQSSRETAEVVSAEHAAVTAPP